MRIRLALTLGCSVLALLVGCDDGGTPTVTVDAAAGATGVPAGDGLQTLRHASGRLMAQGPVKPGTGLRDGHWSEWYDDEAGSRRWEGEYRDGVIDRTRAWREWNANGSVRADAQDH